MAGFCDPQKIDSTRWVSIYSQELQVELLYHLALQEARRLVWANEPGRRISPTSTRGQRHGWLA